MNCRGLIEARIKGKLAMAGYAKKGTCWSKREGKAVLIIHLKRGRSPDCYSFNFGVRYAGIALGGYHPDRSFPCKDSATNSVHWLAGVGDIRRDLAGGQSLFYFSDRSHTLEQRLEIFEDAVDKAIPLLSGCASLEGFQRFLEDLDPSRYFPLFGALPRQFPVDAWFRFRERQVHAFLRDHVGRDQFDKLVAKEVARSRRDKKLQWNLRGNPDHAREKILEQIASRTDLISYRDYCQMKGISPPLPPKPIKSALGGRYRGDRGAFYANVTVFGPKRETVAAAVRKLGVQAVVSTTRRGCTVVADVRSDEEDPRALRDVALELSRSLGCPSLGVMNHDDDIFWYCAYDRGELIDRYHASHEWTGDGHPRGGSGATLAAAFGVPKAGSVAEETLRAEPSGEDPAVGYDTATRRHEDLAKALNLPLQSVGSSFSFPAASVSWVQVPGSERPARKATDGKRLNKQPSYIQ